MNSLPLRKIQSNKKNKRMTNLGNCTFESILRDMTVGMEKEVENLRGELSILSELERDKNVEGKMCRELKRKYKLNEENITTVKETVKQRM